jgi:hypothetical protein
MTTSYLKNNFAKLNIAVKSLNYKKNVQEDLESNASKGIVKKLPDSELNKILDSLPTDEKYSLLLQSYANKILDQKNLDLELISKMESLYYEMLQKCIQPDVKGSQLLIDASSSFCNIDIVTKTIRLVKAGK